MKEVSSSGNYYNTDENLDDLDKILSKINEDIITYKVRNGVIVDGEDFPARVKYGNLSEVQIKVINSATGTEESHTIKKSWVEDFSQFHFSGIYLKPGQKLIITYPAELLPQYRDGVMWPVGNENSYFKLNANIKETMKLPTPRVSATISGSVTVIKTWSEEPSQDIQEVDVVVIGKIMGNPFYLETLKVKKSGTEWRGTLDGLTVYFNGKKIEYDIKEVDVPGYQPNYTAPTETETGKYVFQVHNQKEGTTPSDDLTVKVKKTWLGEMPNQLKVELYQNNTKIDSLIMKKPSDNRSVWDGEFENKVKRLDASGAPYEYKIVENMVAANYSADNTEVILKEVGGGILFGAFTNRNIARVNIPVEKKWVNTPTAEQTPVKVSLYRTIDAGQPPVKVAIEPITLDSDNGFKNVFNFMPVFDSIGENATGKRFIYSVKEEMDSSQFEVSISGDGTDESPFIITNTKKQAGPTTKDIEVAKIWRGQTATSAALALYNIENPSKTDQPIRVMTLPTENGEWEGKFENLPIYGDTGEEIKYSVKEVIRNQADTDYIIIQNGEIFSISDRKYQLIESNENGKWIFINIEQFDSPNPDDDTIHLIVTKNWGNTEEGFKKEVEITLYEKFANQDMAITDKKLFLNKGNYWTGKFENLPKIDREYFAFETKIGDETINVTPEEGLTNYKIGDYQVKIERQDNNIFVTNTHADNPPIQEYIDVQVTKDWGNVSESHRKDVEITLYVLENGILSKSGKEPLLLNQANLYKGVFADLPKKNSQGDELKYYVFETKIGDEAISFTLATDLTSYSFGNYQIQILNNGSGQVVIRNNYTEQVLLPYNPAGDEDDEKEVEEDEIPQGNITDKPKDKDEPKDKDDTKDKDRPKDKDDLKDKDKDKDKQPEEGSDTANKPNEKPDMPKDTVGKEDEIEDTQVPQDKPELPKTGSLGGEMFGLLGMGLISLGKWMKKKKTK